MVSLAARSAARTASSTESRSTPGIESTGARTFEPSTRNSGQIRSSVVSTFSRTMRRAHSARRLRRGRIARSSRSAGLVSFASSFSGRGNGGRDAAAFERPAEFDRHGRAPFYQGSSGSTKLLLAAPTLEPPLAIGLATSWDCHMWPLFRSGASEWGAPSVDGWALRLYPLAIGASGIGLAMGPG